MVRSHPVRLALAVGAFALLSVGCSVGPRYERPAVDVGGTWTETAAPGADPSLSAGQPGSTDAADPASLADRSWWLLFDDQELVALVDEALTRGHDVRLAAWQVEEARALAGVASSTRWPAAAAGASVGRGRSSGFVVPGGPTTDRIAVDLGVSWEVDLWGRLAHLEDAARARLLATEEAHRGVRLSLVAEVAGSAFRLRALDLRLEVERRAEAAFEETRELFAVRRDAGLASSLETATAEAALGEARSRTAELERRIAAEENRLAVLLGRRPGPIGRSTGLREQLLPPSVPAGLPAQLLERRPDLRRLEQELVAANAEVGVATAELLPRLSLTAAFGGVSPELSDLLDSGRTWSVGGGLLTPVVQGSRLRDQRRAAVARWEQARVRYEAGVVRALAEVATGLASHRDLERAEREQAAAVDAAGEAVELATDRYVSGLASYLEVLEAQRQLFPAEATLADVRLARLLTLLDLYRALGGGWNDPDGPGPRPDSQVAASHVPGPPGRSR